MMRLFFVSLFMVLLTTSWGYAQNSATLATTKTAVDASVSADTTSYLADNATPEAVAKALLATITGGKGEKIDTVRLGNLFFPDAQMGLVREKDGVAKVQTFPAAGFISRSPKMYEPIDFYEAQIGITINEFGNIAQVFQAYQTKGAKNAKGINSYQLMKENGAWRIVSLIFQDETDRLFIPKEYLD